MGYRIVFVLPGGKGSRQAGELPRISGYGTVTGQQERDRIFREICLKLRENLTYHLRMQTRTDITAAGEQAETSSLAYFKENTSIFKACSEEFH